MKQTISHQSNPPYAALSAEDLRGVLLPITTPFDAGGNLDLSALGANIAKWNQSGISGYVLLGSTGERLHLDEQEYLEVIATARAGIEQRRNGLTFIVGAGQQSTRGTVSEIRRVAAAVAVDAFLVITPSFYRPSITQQALITYYESIADSSPEPIILYSMPALTSIKIEPETAARLSEHENIIGIKDSSNDLGGLRETIKLVGKDFAVLTGNGTVLNEALNAGACGGILAVGCVAPAVCLAIFRAIQSGDIDTAAMLQAKLTPLAEAVTIRFGIGGLKAALDLKGYVGGTVRAPLRAPDDEAREEIRGCLAAAERELNALSVQQTAR
ncbi:MAG TPA: dihydrodipicolinate synthase family protein [Pyrinomonadaceae bacterium]|nr:dihydrodipicolinate synthase family protein [Pyrinomonadaceae bacterium]